MEQLKDFTRKLARANDFLNKWTRRTQCIEEVEMQFCSGYVPPEPEPIAGQPAAPEPAPVNSTSPFFETDVRGSSFAVKTARSVTSREVPSSK